MLMGTLTWLVPFCDRFHDQNIGRHYVPTFEEKTEIRTHLIETGHRQGEVLRVEKFTQKNRRPARRTEVYYTIFLSVNDPKEKFGKPAHYTYTFCMGIDPPGKGLMRLA